MSFYRVFPGVSIAYNDFRLDSYHSGFQVGADMLCIDHCREGRIEQPLSGGTYSYVAAGDLKIDDRTRHTGEFVLPRAHYRGITVSFELEHAERSIAEAIEGFPVNLRALRERFCHDGDPLIMHDVPGVEHIFSELYSVPEEIREPYSKLKVLELLLFLQVLEPAPADARRPYFYRSQVEKVKAARGLMVADLSVDRTIEELAAHFDLPPPRSSRASKACTACRRTRICAPAGWSAPRSFCATPTCAWRTSASWWATTARPSSPPRSGTSSARRRPPIAASGK